MTTTIQLAPDPALEGLISDINAVFTSWGPETTVDQMRAGWESLFSDQPLTVNATSVPIEGTDFAAELISAPNANPEKVVLYLHGGGYVIGSVNSYRDMCERLSRASGAQVLGLDYRRAPEHPFPAAVDDAVAAYWWLIERGIAPKHIAIAGDSAGGALTLAVLFAIRERGAEMPSCGVPISPWIDLEYTGTSMVTRVALDPMCSKEVLGGCAKLYLPDSDYANPLAAPIHGDLTGLPPLFITVGSRETLLDDALRLADMAKDAGVSTDLRIYEGQIHVFQIFAARMAAAESAIQDIGRFISYHMK